ncbi:MAG: DUF814 domain-containing protein [bacterium]|nr:DUF814 domain-containing protein [bacterium]
MDTLTVLAISKSLDGLVGGKESAGIITVERDVFALKFRGLPGGVILRLSNPVAIYYSDEQLKQSRDFPLFSVADILDGAAVKKVEQYGDDRIICFELDCKGNETALVIEVFRRPPSIYLVSSGGETTTIYGRRTEGDYVFPPDFSTGKTAFGEVAPDEIARLLDSESRADNLKDSISHLSPPIADYLSGKDADNIYDIFQSTGKAVENGTGVAQFIGGNWAAYPAAIFGDCETKEFDSIHRAVAFAAMETGCIRELESARSAVNRSLSRRKKKLEKQRQALSEELAEFEEPERIRGIGDLLKSNFHLIKRGSDSIVVEDYSSGGEVEIELNPAFTPEANMESYYKRYRKALTGKKKVKERLEYIDSELAKIEGGLRATEEATDAKDIEYLLPEDRSGTTEKSVKTVGRRYVSSDGFEIVVGRGAKENDAVTFGVGRPNDLWLHVREAQGSHVIVRCRERGKPFPKRTVDEAAAIAAYFSKSRNAEIVPVIVTERRYVSKVKGSPGLVRVMQEEVIFVAPGEVLKPGG